MTQAQTVLSPPLPVRRPWFAVIAGYLLLAATYHAAEYAMRFHQHIPLFLGLMLGVVVVAHLVARVQGFRGLGALGMSLGKPYQKLFLVGLLISLAVNGLALWVRLWLGIELMGQMPDLDVLLTQTLIFALSTFLPSLGEDILTRGYLFGHFRKRMHPWVLILFSSAVYVLNHIYALTSGPTMLIYLFVLGIMLAIPLLYTKNLWYTVGAHWAGNIVYRLGNDVLQVREVADSFPPIWVLTGFVLLLALINYLVAKKYSPKDEPSVLA